MRVPTVQPGEILAEAFLKPMGISADTALRLARYFGSTGAFWTGLQSHYETELVKMQLGDRLLTEV